MYFLLLILIKFCFSELISTNVDIGIENVASASIPNRGLVFFAGGFARYIDGPETNVKTINIYNFNINN